MLKVGIQNAFFFNWFTKSTWAFKSNQLNSLCKRENFLRRMCRYFRLLGVDTHRKARVIVIHCRLSIWSFSVKLKECMEWDCQSIFLCVVSNLTCIFICELPIELEEVIWTKVLPSLDFWRSWQRKWVLRSLQHFAEVLVVRKKSDSGGSDASWPIGNSTAAWFHTM